MRVCDGDCLPSGNTAVGTVVSEQPQGMHHRTSALGTAGEIVIFLLPRPTA